MYVADEVNVPSLCMRADIIHTNIPSMRASIKRQGVYNWGASKVPRCARQLLEEGPASEPCLRSIAALRTGPWGVMTLFHGHSPLS